jgi:O-antigen/teichoic acid export membrane protein
MTAPAPRDPTFRRDIVSAYLASACRVGSWVIVSALVYRYSGAEAFGLLALIRGTLGILNYVTLGLAPALIHLAADAGRGRQPSAVAARHSPQVLSYQGRAKPSVPDYDAPLAVLYRSALLITSAGSTVGALATSAYALWFNRIYPGFAHLDADTTMVVIQMGLGTLARLIGDAPGAVLQVRSRISLDNGLVALGDLVWAGLVAVVFLSHFPGPFYLVAPTYFLSGLLPLAARLYVAHRETGIIRIRAEGLSGSTSRALLSYGSMVVAAQLADYLYAPTDYILIGRLLHAADLASYAPAVQIDAGLLLLVTGLSAVLLPKTAVAHAAGSSDTVRRYYVRGTLASLAMLATASAIIWLISPWIFRLWLGNPMPATQAILPLVLVNTVLGGSSAVGRSILLAVGKVRPFTIAALTSGAANVACSYLFVRYLNLGLKGIVLGTVVAVVGRCVLWMPWYVLSTIRATGNIEPLMPLPVVPES